VARAERAEQNHGWESDSRDTVGEENRGKSRARRAKSRLGI
jgi:hypothetical protein